MTNWQADHDELAGALAEADTFRGWDPADLPEAPLVPLKRGERVYLVLDAAALIERRVAAEGPDLLDHGAAVVTDRRVVFQGDKQSKEWLFSKLVGYEHLSGEPATLVQVSNRRRLSGIRYNAATATSFRRRLALAVAVANGSAEALASLVRSQLAEHETHRQAVVMAPPAAPVRRRVPRWARIAGPVVGALLVLGAITSEDEDEPDTVQVEAAADDEGSTTTERLDPTSTTAAATTVAPPTTTTTTLPPATTTTAPPPPPPAPTTTAPPPPPPPTTAAPAPVVAPQRTNGCHPSYDPCVPIASDVDCAGGSGNGPAYASGPIRVVGPDVYDLDRDGDGVACE